MDPYKFTTIAHADHTLCSPFDLARLDRLLVLCDLDHDSRVLDIGCGKGAVLDRLCGATLASGLGLDVNPSFLDAARALINTHLTFLEADAASYHPDAPYDLIICLGASGALGGYEGVLTTCRDWLAPVGNLLIGEGFWERNPDPAYLAATGIPRDEMTSHDGTIARAEALGWSCIDSLKASIDEWDHYENLYRDGIEQYIAAHPDDPDTPAMRDRIRHWHNAYLTWGRGTLGFGVYLLRL